MRRRCKGAGETADEFNEYEGVEFSKNAILVGSQVVFYWTRLRHWGSYFMVRRIPACSNAQYFSFSVNATYCWTILVGIAPDTN
jgi:hypothetical protein